VSCNLAVSHCYLNNKLDFVAYLLNFLTYMYFPGPMYCWWQQTRQTDRRPCHPVCVSCYQHLPAFVTTLVNNCGYDPVDQTCDLVTLMPAVETLTPTFNQSLHNHTRALVTIYLKPVRPHTDTVPSSLTNHAMTLNLWTTQAFGNMQTTQTV